MMGDPIVMVWCDRCEIETECRLTPLAQRAWDARNVPGDLKRDGWVVDGDEHICPDCADVEFGTDD